jgi:hypothetical protein
VHVATSMRYRGAAKGDAMGQIGRGRAGVGAGGAAPVRKILTGSTILAGSEPPVKPDAMGITRLRARGGFIR